MKLPKPPDQEVQHVKPKKDPPTNGTNLLPRSNKGQGSRRVSLEVEINKYLSRNPKKAKKIAEVIVRAACGELTETEARNLQKVRGIDFAKIVLERVDGPVAKRLDLSIKTDKTLVLHEGPAVNIDELMSRAEDAEVIGGEG